MGKRIITISRECGSMGNEIGEAVAKKLGIAYYEKRILELASQKSGLDPEFIKEYGEFQRPSLLFGLSIDPAFTMNTLSGDFVQLADKVFFLQSEIIKEVANKEPCVIMGRCADYVLSERDDVLNVYIYADMKDKIEYEIKTRNADPKKVEGEIRKKDKARSSHYAHYTGKKWGNTKNYDLCLNISQIGFETAVTVIAGAYD